jgi:pentatricopeptide repeat protein
MRTANPPAAPDMVTYSTLVKGFCASGDLDTALGLLEEMRKQGTFTADEMLYNTLLSGCAREQRISDALRIVNEMRDTGVAPSNYTLSMLVKLLGRCKRLNQVFSIVEELTAEFGIRLNIQVYTCMIQACFHNRQPAKALALFDRLIADGLRPDEKTNVALLRGFLQMNQVDMAVGMIRKACEGNDPACIDAICVDLVIAKLGVKSEAAKSLTQEVEAARHRIRTVNSRGNPPYRRSNQVSANYRGNHQAPHASAKNWQDAKVASGLGQQTSWRASSNDSNKSTSSSSHGSHGSTNNDSNGSGVVLTE